MITLLIFYSVYAAVALLVGIQAYHLASKQSRTTWWEGEADRIGAVLAGIFWPFVLAAAAAWAFRRLGAKLRALLTQWTNGSRS